MNKEIKKKKSGQKGERGRQEQKGGEEKIVETLRKKKGSAATLIPCE
jgi:hypothetical protein